MQCHNCVSMSQLYVHSHCLISTLSILWSDSTQVHGKGMALLKKLRVPEDEEVFGDFADLMGAIEDAEGK